MPKYTIKNVTAEADTLDEARRLATVAYLRHIAGIDAPEPTEQEIDALLAEMETEETERLDLADLGRQVAAELAWLDSIIAGWATLTPEQKDTAQKRELQEIRAILRAMRAVVRRLA